MRLVIGGVSFMHEYATVVKLETSAYGKYTEYSRLMCTGYAYTCTLTLVWVYSGVTFLHEQNSFMFTQPPVTDNSLNSYSEANT